MLLLSFKMLKRWLTNFNSYYVKWNGRPVIVKYLTELILPSGNVAIPLGHLKLHKTEHNKQHILEQLNIVQLNLSGLFLAPH